MLTKFISVSENHFQNTKIALKNQQVSIQGLETQIGQHAKLISEQPQGSLPSNTESNPREQLNAITVREKEGLVEPEPESRQGIVVSKGKDEVDHSEQKPVNSHFVWVMKQSLFKLETHLKSIYEPYSVDPRIATAEPNGAIPFTVLNIFPYGTVEFSRSKSLTESLNTDGPNPHGQAHDRGRNCQNNTGMGEVNEVEHDRAT
ncbi:hypothetical protein GOBAR_AA06585 [Gossypium barbadense]|uniref:Uncharacterized protein n=1 Tax=Gossypium barbadense TaxID=3634 RepID=A0A2P5YEG9_GOSBA|nr:hypothetical protein GOBAR_AA06585 [Gossypium barbadense]